MIKAIIFDWHGVLDTTKYEDLILVIAELTHKSREYIKDIISPYERSYTAGLITPEYFWETVKKQFRLDDIQMMLLKNAILIVRKNQMLWEKLYTLRKLYLFAILSDCPPDKVEKIRSEINLSDFTISHFSGELHMLKNSDEFFTTICSALHLTPHQCLYVDDSLRHIQTANRLGFQTCHFQSIEDLNIALKRQLIGRK